jgi:hypothetical protein
MHLRLLKCSSGHVVLIDKAVPNLAIMCPACETNGVKGATMSVIGETFVALYQEAGPITAAHMEGSK